MSNICEQRWGLLSWLIFHYEKIFFRFEKSDNPDRISHATRVYDFFILTNKRI